MSDANVVTGKELARILGYVPSYITQLKQEGRLVPSPDGKRFLLAESRKLLAETADPAKAGVAARHAAARGAAATHEAVGQGVDQDDADAPLVSIPDDPLAKRRALAQAQAEEAKARKLLRDEAVELGQLLPVDEVRSAIANALTALRTDLENLPSIMAAQVAAEDDESRIRLLLRDAIEHQLRETSRRLGKLAP